MSDENKVVEGEFVDVTESEVVVKKSKLDGVKTFGKKHGKKIVAGIAGITLLGLGYAMGKRSSEDSTDLMEYDEDEDSYETEESEI